VTGLFVGWITILGDKLVLRMATKNDHRVLSEGYSFHRLAEARLRIVTNRPLNEYPDDPQELEKLARRMGFASGAEFHQALSEHARNVREAFERLAT